MTRIGILPHILDKLFEETIMTTQTSTQKRKDDTLEEILRVVQELKAITQTNNINKTPTIKEIEKNTKPVFHVYDVPLGGRFYRQRIINDKEMYLRLRPTSYLLNSTLVQENLTLGKVLVANLSTGSCYFILGSEEIIPLP